MTTLSNERRFAKRKALLAGLAGLGVFGMLTVGTNAQEAKKDKVADDRAVRAAVELSGYTRPGNPDDAFGAQGELIRKMGFEAESLKQFKIMGATVYFAVFRNTGRAEGDAFATGMANFDAKFEAGRSFKD